MTCTTTAGTAGGDLPIAGAFTSQIHFDVSTEASTVALNTTLNVSPIGVTSVKLYEWDGMGGAIVAGTADRAGVLLATASLTAVPGGSVWAIETVLDPAGSNSFFVEVVGATTGAEAQYTQQIALSAIPLPPALILLATALFGLIGVGRIRRRRAVAA